MNLIGKLCGRAGLVFSLMLASTSINAATYWLNDLTIKEVQLFYDGGYKLRVYVNETITTGCAGDTQGMLTYHGASMDQHLKGMQPLLQQAVASGVTVNLAYANSCYAGYGALLYGVGVKAE